MLDLRAGGRSVAEPILTGADIAAWRAWCAEALAWSRTRAHAARVDSARRTVAEMLAAHPDAYVSWSGGKDSTALTYLLCPDVGASVRAMSVKDDLDFPGEVAYVSDLASSWGIHLDVIRPAMSLQGWLAERGADFDPRDDVHARTAELSRRAFYTPVDEYSVRLGRPGVFLGLRSEESYGRRMSRATRGRIYRKANGDVICNPLADWRAVDVYAYLLSRGVPLVPLYRCVRLHEHPGRVRKSWWLPGAAHDRGGARWLRTYYPSLWGRLVELVPAAAYYD